MAPRSRKDECGSPPPPDGVPSPLQSFDPGAILATLRRHDVAFVVIGAYAAVTQGWSEPTSDIDITPDRDIRLERLRGDRQ